jgi:hypothetical protein
MDEIKAGQQQAKGAAAQSLLESETLKAAFAYLEAEYLKTWRYETRVRDVEARERLWTAVHILHKVQDHLKQWVIDGKIAGRDLANMKYIKR